MISEYKSIVAIVSLAGAFYLASNDKEGWGWFIFIAFCCL